MMKELTKTPLKSGLLINEAGEGKYLNKDAINNVIKYIARENGKPKDDLICCGAIGATDFTDTDTTICSLNVYNCCISVKAILDVILTMKYTLFPRKKNI